MPRDRAANLPARSLAHLGDAVFHLFEREREVVLEASAQEMHKRARVSASTQAQILEALMPHLGEAELDIVRRARNIKATGSRRSEQATYRRATAFEALLGYLYLTSFERLRQVLELTLPEAGSEVVESKKNNP